MKSNQHSHEQKKKAFTILSSIIYYFEKDNATSQCACICSQPHLRRTDQLLLTRICIESWIFFMRKQRKISEVDRSQYQSKLNTPEATITRDKPCLFEVCIEWFINQKWLIEMIFFPLVKIVVFEKYIFNENIERYSCLT